MTLILGKIARFSLFTALAIGVYFAPLAVASDLLHQFAAKYKAAKTEQAKVAVCIKAIDMGLIARGSPVENVDSIFGTDFSKHVPKEGETVKTVLFKYHAPNTNDAFQADLSGWCLAVSFGSTGKITKYYISNLSK